MRPTPWLSVGGRVGWLDRPSLGAPAGTFQRGNPPTQEVFPGDPVFAVSPQPSFAYREASIAVDTRNRPGHPTTGGLYRAAWAGYTDQDHGAFSFRRSEVEAAHFIPVSRSRVVFAMHGWLVASHTADDEWVPFYLEPSLGGHNTLRSFSEYRFHDRNLLLVNLETRIALFNHLDAAVFVDAGNVAAACRRRESRQAFLRCRPAIALSRIHVRTCRYRAGRRGMAVHAPVERSAAAQAAHAPDGARAVRPLSWRRVMRHLLSLTLPAMMAMQLSFCAARDPSDDVSAGRTAGEPVGRPRRPERTAMPSMVRGAPGARPIRRLATRWFSGNTAASIPG